MRKINRVRFVLCGFLWLTGCFTARLSWADSVLANQFGREAGVIAGTTQACGTSISEYNSRVIEAINALSKTPGDRETATTVYMDALSKSLDAQTKNHVMACSQVVQSFYSLPLMRSDYKTSVLPQLASMVNPTNTPAATTQTTVTTLSQQPTVATQTLVTGAK